MTDEGGDPACWLDQICDDCGAVIGDHDDHACPAAVAATPDPSDHGASRP